MTRVKNRYDWYRPMTLGEIERLDKLLQLAYTMTDNRLQGVQLEYWALYMQMYPNVTQPKDLAWFVDFIVKMCTPEFMESTVKCVKICAHIIVDLIIPHCNSLKKKKKKKSFENNS